MRVMRRRIGEWLLSAGTIVVLLLILLVIYNPIREDVSRRVTKPSAEISSLVHRVGYQVDAFAALALETSRTHSELVVFAVAAVVLLGFMLRT
jgi:hypothetical protein